MSAEWIHCPDPLAVRCPGCSAVLPFVAPAGWVVYVRLRPTMATRTRAPRGPWFDLRHERCRSILELWVDRTEVPLRAA